MRIFYSSIFILFLAICGTDLSAQAPTSPTGLFVGNDEAQSGSSGDPVVEINHKPVFSAFFHHESPAATASQARVQIATDAAFTAVVVTTSWRPATGAEGQRISDIEYAGNKLDCGTRYWWRISIRDGASTASPWSTEIASFQTVLCPAGPTTLFVDSIAAQEGTQGDPVPAISLKPYLSAVATHESPSGVLTDAKVQFASDAGFASILATTGWKTIGLTTAGQRCPDIQYAGSALPPGTRIWWRIKCRDTVGIVGPWSTEPASFVTVPLPLAPTQLFVGNEEAQTGSQGDPVTSINLKPYFSATFQDSLPSKVGTKVRIEIAADAAFQSVVVATSWKSIPDTSVGARCADIAYNGSALLCGARYWWRIAFKDSFDNIGAWSTEPASFQTVLCPDSPASLFVGSVEAQTGAQGDPVTNIILKPYFSAVSTHGDANTAVTSAKLEFALDADFAQVIATTGWKTVAPTLAGGRCSDVRYTGNAFDGFTQIWWRIRFRDTAGITGPWSVEPASFITTPLPLPPTDLFVQSNNAQNGSSGNPVHFVDQTPHFSVIAHHQDTQAQITALKVQIARDAAFTDTVWTSSWKPIAATTDGFRTPDVDYTGSALLLDTIYYWRVKSQDATAQQSDWSTEGASFVTDFNTPPELGTINNETLTEGVSFSVTLSAFDPDPNTVLTYSATGLPVGASLDAESGEFTWTPGFSQAGQYTITFRVTDNDPSIPLFDEQSALFTVQDANGQPTLNTTSGETQFSVLEDASILIPLTVTDPDLNDGLSVTGLLTGGLPLPEGAHIVLGAQGYRFEWAPTFGQSGTYGIHLTVTDNGVPPRSASVTIVVEVQNVNRPPVLQAIAPIQVAEGAAVSLPLLATDPDSQDTLSFSSGAPLPLGAVLDPETGLFIWTPDFTQAGHYEITFTVSDDSQPVLSNSKLAVIDVSNTNRPPIIEPIGNYLIYEGAPLSFSVTAYDEDAGEQVLLTATLADGSPLPAGAQLTGSSFTWTPTFQQAGTYQLRFTATDDCATPASSTRDNTVTVVNVNRAPALANAVSLTINEGDPFTHQLLVLDPDSWDAHSFAMQAAEGGALPAGLGLNAETGLLSWTPNYAQAGAWPIVLTVTDNGVPPLSGTAAITITVSDVPHSVTLVSFFPEANASSVAPNVGVDAAFSEPMASPQAGEFAVSSKWRGAVPGVVGLDGDSIQFHPSLGFMAGELVSVTAAGTLRSSSEATLGQPFMWQFRVATAPSEAGFSQQVAPFGSASSEVRDIILADFDGDGDLDALVLATSASAANYIYRNDGAGNMAAVSIVGTGAPGPAGIRAFDYNGDSATDILYWIGSTAYIYTNAGSLQFNLAASYPLQPGLSELEIGDMSADGRVDLVTVTDVGLVTVMERDSSGFTQASTFDMGLGIPGTYLLELADVYADGRLEVVVANAGQVQVLTYNSPLVSAQSFPHTAGSLKDLDVADSNGDRVPDIYITGETLWAFTANAEFHYGLGTFLDMNGSAVQDVDIGDLDGDGDQDMLVAFADYTLAMLNAGNGQVFAAHEAIGNAIGGDPAIIKRALAADMNGDRKLDVLEIRAAGFGRTFFNSDRLHASLHDASGVAPYTGEGQVMVPVTLDFVPVNAVTVFYETVEAPPPPPPSEGENDGLPDPADFLGAQVTPPALGYIPTSGVLTFPPGIQTKWVPITLTATGAAFVQLSIQIRISVIVGVPGSIQPGGVLVSVAQSAVSIVQPGASTTVPTVTAGSQDWQIDGTVFTAERAANGNTYFGGDFGSVSWAANAFSARSLTSGFPSGLSLPLPAGSKVYAIECAQYAGPPAIEDIYLGGEFVFTVGGLEYRNVVRLRNGVIDTTFRPNPRSNPITNPSRVRTMKLDASGSLFLGGRFDTVDLYANSSSTVTSVETCHNLIRCTQTQVKAASAGVKPQFTAEVYDIATLASETFVVGAFGEVVADTFASAPTGTVRNGFAAFNSGNLASDDFASFSGVVRTVLIDGALIYIGGNFSVFSGAKTHHNLAQLSFTGSFYSATGAVFKSTTNPTTSAPRPVNDLLFIPSNPSNGAKRLAAAQEGKVSGSVVEESLVYYELAGTGPDFYPTASFFNPHRNAMSLASNAAGDRLWVASVDAAQGAGLEDNVASYDVDPGSQHFMFRDQTADGHVMGSAFTAVTLPPFGSNPERLAIGGDYSRTALRRGNIAAFDQNRTLLEWGPRTNGPVYSIVFDNNDVYIGGAFNIVNRFLDQGTVGWLGFAVRRIAKTSLTPSYGYWIDSTWQHGVEGTSPEIHVLKVHQRPSTGEKFLFVGGKFESVDGAGWRDGIARYSLTQQQWSPWRSLTQLTSAGLTQPGMNVGVGTGTVFDIAVDENNGLVYFGGDFSLFDGRALQGIAAAGIATPGAVDLTFVPPPLAPFGAGAVVKAVALDPATNVIFVGGSFAMPGQAPDDKQNLVDLQATYGFVSDATWYPDPNDTVESLAITGGGHLLVGGSFSIFAGSAHEGLAYVDVPTRLTEHGWSPNLFSTSGDAVLHVSAHGTRLVVGGSFGNPGTADRKHLTEYEVPLEITPGTLPTVTEGVPFNIQLGLTEPFVVTQWGGTGFPFVNQWVSISQTGELSGLFPLGLAQQFAIDITATVSSIQMVKHYVLNVAAAPSITLRPNVPTAVPPRSEFSENDEAAQLITAALNLDLAVPASGTIVVELEAVDNSAVQGRDFALASSIATFGPGSTTTSVDLYIFGDDTTDYSPRQFVLRLKRVVSGVATIAPNSDVEIWILEDDAQAPRYAVAANLEIRNDAATPAVSDHVVANNPLFEWDFLSDDPRRVQHAYSVQVFDNAALLGPGVWATTNVTALDGVTYAGPPLLEGWFYWVRVVLTDDAQVVGSPSVASFRLNTAPGAVTSSMLLAPVGAGQTDGTPMFEFSGAFDAEGDALAYTIKVMDQTTQQQWTLDSAVASSLFSYFDGSTWRSLAGAGVPSTALSVRAEWPAHMSLINGTYDWWVDVRDFYETTVGTQQTSFALSVAYTFEGDVVLPSGQVDTAYDGQDVAVVRVSTGAQLAVATATAGRFVLVAQTPLNFGEPLAVYLLDGRASPVLGSTVFQFDGADIVAPASGAGLVVGHDALVLQQRTNMPLEGTAFGVPTSFADTRIGWSLTTPFEATLADWVQTIEIDGTLRLSGPSAGRPAKVRRSTTASASVALIVGQQSRLELSNGGVLEMDSGVFEGEVAVEAGGTLDVGTGAQVLGLMQLGLYSLCNMNAGHLSVVSGVLSITGGSIVDLADFGYVEAGAGGSVNIQTAELTGVRVIVRSNAAMPVLNNIRFTGAANSAPSAGGIASHVLWEYVDATESESTVANVAEFRVALLSGEYNVVATTAASPLSFMGAFGLGAGEALDFDPGDVAGAGIVRWELVSIADLVAISGDNLVRLDWDGGGQASSTLSYWVYRDTAPAMQAAIKLAEVSVPTFVDATAQNGVTYFYRVLLGDSVSAQSFPLTGSNVASSTPKAASLVGVSPGFLNTDGTTTLTIIGNATHWDASVDISFNDNSYSVLPGSLSIVTASLMVVQVEGMFGQPGSTVQMTITQADIWGIAGYDEQLVATLTTTAPVTSASPSIEFSLNQGGVDEGEVTNGQFSITIEWDSNTGAPVDFGTLEVYASSPLQVSGIVVGTPGTPGALLTSSNLADPLYGVFSVSGSQAQAVAVIEQPSQIGSSTPVGVERFEPGLIMLCARVRNEFGYLSSWAFRQCFVDGYRPDVARAYGSLTQGATSVVSIFGTNIAAAQSVEFATGSGIVQVGSLSALPSQQTPAGTDYGWEATFACADDCDVGYVVALVKSGPATLATVTFNVNETASSLIGVQTAPQAGYNSAKGAWNVNLQTGYFCWEQLDLETGGRARGLQWSRTHRSDTGLASHLGKGWASPYLQVIVESTSQSSYDLTWINPYGDRYLFTYISGGTYQAPTGVAAELLDVQDDRLLRFADGSSILFAKQTMGSRSFRIKSLCDPSGNRSTFHYTKPSDHAARLAYVLNDVASADESIDAPTAGEALRFEYYSNNRIQRVSHVVANGSGSIAAGTWGATVRSVEYRYTNDRIDTVLLPETARYSAALGNAAAYAYEYDNQNRLEKLYNPADVVVSSSGHAVFQSIPATAFSTPFLVNVYNGNRVTNQVTNNNRHTQITYNSTVSTETIIVKPEGNVLVYELNSDGQAAKISPKASVSAADTFAVEHEYDSRQQLIETRLPKGNVVEYSYGLGSPADNGTQMGLSDLEVASIGGYSTSGGYTPLGFEAGALNGITGTVSFVELELLEGVDSGVSTFPLQRRVYAVQSVNGDQIRVTGNLHEGDWAQSGTKLLASLFYANSDALTLHLPSQVIAKPTAGAKPSECHISFTRYGRVVQNGAVRIDAKSSITPYMETFVVNSTCPAPYGSETDYVSWRSESVAVLTRTIDGGVFKDTLETKVQSDGHGRTLTEHGPMAIDSDVVDDDEEREMSFLPTDDDVDSPRALAEYQYYDEATNLGASRGRLKSVRQNERGNGDQGYWLTTSYVYDTRGFVVKIVPPAGNAGGAVNDNFATLLSVNELGQVWKTAGPIVAGSSVGQRPLSVFYFDKSGRTTYEIQSWLPGSALHGQTSVLLSAPGNAESMKDVDISTAYLAPVGTGPGWVTTSYAYTMLDEVQSVSKQHVAWDLNDPTVANVGSVSTLIRYDGNSRVAWMQTPHNATHDHVATITYNERDLPVERHQKKVSRSQGPQAVAEELRLLEKLTYDNNGSVHTAQDSIGRVMTYSYDGFDRITSTEYPVGNAGVALVSTVEYSKPFESEIFTRETLHSKGTSAQAIAGTQARQTTRFLDGAGRLYKTRIRAVDSTGAKLMPAVEGEAEGIATSRIEYGRTSRVSATRSPSGVLLRHVSDALGRERFVRDFRTGWPNSEPYGAQTETEYGSDDVSQVSTETGYLRGSNALFTNRTEISLDVWGNPLRVVDADGIASEHLYTGHGQLYESKTTGNSMAAGEVMVQHYRYDFEGRVIETEAIRTGDNTMTRAAYDEAGRLAAEWVLVDDGTGAQNVWRKTGYEYNIKGQLEKRIQPDGQAHIYSYDDVDRIKTITYPTAMQVKYEYSNTDELLSVEVLNRPSSVRGAVRETFEYDEWGQVLASKVFYDGVGQEIVRNEYKYNSLGLAEELTQHVRLPNGQDVPVTFNPIPASFADPAELGFDPMPAYSSGVSFTSWNTKLEHNVAGMLKVMTYWDDRVVKYEHDNLSRVSRVYETTGGSGSTGELLNLEYHGWNRLVKRNAFEQGARHAGYASQNRTYTAFKYSDAGRVLGRGSVEGGTALIVSAFQRAHDDHGRINSERWHEAGGRGKSWQYDESGRLTHSCAGVPLNLAGGLLAPLSGTPSSFSWLTTYEFDQADNFKQALEYGPGNTLAKTTEFNRDTIRNLYTGKTETISGQSSTVVPGAYNYDVLERMTSDNTSGLDYFYDYAGRLVEASSGGTLLRQIVYDAAGRKTLEINGTTDANKLYTLTVHDPSGQSASLGPNAAGEVTFKYDGVNPGQATGAVQFTNGDGLVGNGVGEKRLIEFVCYVSGERSPFYRHLLEDAVGSTVCTTNQFGTQLDEITYEDYGRPIWKAVLASFEGSATQHSTDNYMTTVVANTSLGDITGCEIAAVNPDATTAKDRFVSAMVMDNGQNSINVFDPTGRFFTAAGGANSQFIVYVHQSGHMKVRVTNVEVHQRTIGGQQQTVTEVHIEHPAFVNLAGNSVTVLNTDPATPTSWHQWTGATFGQYFTGGYVLPGLGSTIIAIPGDQSSSIDEGDILVADLNSPKVTRAGRVLGASPSGASGAGAYSVLQLDGLDNLSPNMVGWLCQPNTSYQVYFEVVAVTASSVTVAGDVTPLYDNNLSTVGTKDYRWMLIMPPGISPFKAVACALTDGPLDQTTSCMFAGYRYMSPLVGFSDGITFTKGQSGRNLASLYYVLNRYYDPELGRFTTPDPAASPFYNLLGYAGGNPVWYVDPEGLDYASLWSAIKSGEPGKIWDAWAGDVRGVRANVRQNVSRYNREGWDQYRDDVGTAGAGYVAGVADNVYLGDAVTKGFASLGVDTESDLYSAGRVVGMISGAVVLAALTAGTSSTAVWGARGLMVLDAVQAGRAAASGDWTTAGLLMVGHGGGRMLGKMARGMRPSRVLKKATQFFVDNRTFNAVRKQYWREAGGAGGRSLHHWLIPQRASWVPQRIRNAGWNLLVVDSRPTIRGLNLNTWMGFALSNKGAWKGRVADRIGAFALENSIRIGIPGLLLGAAYAGYQDGQGD